MYNKSIIWVIVFVLLIMGADIYYNFAEQGVTLWTTEWFIWRVVLLIIILVSIGIYFRMKQQILSAQEKQEFIRKLIDVQESEKKRISFELHDNIGQNLLVINNDILKINRNLSEDNPVKKQLEKVSASALQSIEDIRNISSGIFPHQIKKLGLKKAIESMSVKILGEFNIEAETDICEIDNILKNDKGLVLFRIIQEAVNNIAKHSKAKKAKIKIYTLGKRLITEITDDGSGFDIKKLNSHTSNGFGLFNMTERTKAIGGRFNIISEPGRETKIKISIPLHF
ncbi:MAG TPA: ATP-binding protein [Ignavibacteria bacterium]